jgi:hypothetical protein
MVLPKGSPVRTIHRSANLLIQASTGAWPDHP